MDYSEKILQQYPDLDLTNRNDAQRSAAFYRLLRSTKKKQRRDLVRSELRIRLHHKGLYHSIRRKARARMDLLAMVLHWAERGEEIQFDLLCSTGKKFVKMSPKEQKRELQKRGLSCNGSKKRNQNRLLAAVWQDRDAKIMQRHRQALTERGLDDGGNVREITDRLAKSVLELEEDAF